MKKLILIQFITLTSIFGFSQNRYILLDSRENSDLNYEAISVGNFNSGIILDSVFNFVPGEFIVYRFIELNYGPFFESDSLREYRDLLIIKTKPSGKIIDAYQYTLDWAVYPSCIDLYRLNKVKKSKFTSPYNLSNLQFKRVKNKFYYRALRDYRDPYLTLSQKLFWKTNFK